MEMGPINSLAMLAFLVVGLAFVGASLWRMFNARVVRAIPLVVMLAMPLAFSVWASTWQFSSNVQIADAQTNALMIQTMHAMALSMAVHTQMAAGIVVTALSGTLLVGAVLLTVPGERPRRQLGATAMGLTIALVLTAAASVTLAPSVALASRAALYLAAGVVATMALIHAHKRGPGVQLATLVAVAFPLLVAGLDQLTTSAWAYHALVDIAVAAPVDRAPMRASFLGTMATLQTFSGMHLGLAAGLAALGPLATLRGERQIALQHALAMGVGVVVAGAGLGWASSWLVSL